MTATRSFSRAAFMSAAAAMFVVAWAMTRTAAFTNDDALALALYADALVSLPVVYAVLLLRDQKRAWVKAAPVAALATLVARVFVGARPGLRVPVAIGGALVETLLLFAAARRARIARDELDGASSNDVLVRVATLSDPLLRLLATEIAVLYYAFVGPWVRHVARAGDHGYTRTSGLAGTLAALGMLATVEGLIAHLIVRPYSATVAWVLTAANIYLVLWLVAAYHAARLRPIVLDENGLLVRTSVLWTVETPRSAVFSIEPAGTALQTPQVLRATLGGAPNVVVTLSRPSVALGLFGVRRRVTKIAFFVDDPARLLRAWAAQEESNVMGSS